MSFIGDFALGSTFDTKFCTVTTTGAPTTIGGTWAISIYVDNSLTQLGPATVATPAAGITITLDFDGITGMHNVRVVATSGNGYAAGSNYQIMVSTGTVGGTSIVGYVVAEFSIEARSSLRPTTSGRTLDVSATGEAGIDWANVGSPTTVLNLSATNIDVDQVVASVSGAVGSVTGAVGSVTGAVGSIGTGGIATTSFAAGAIDAAAIAADAIGAAEIANGAIDAATFAAGAIDAAAIAANALGTSEIATAVDDRIVDAVWNELRSGHTTVGTYGENNAAIVSGGAITGTLSTTQMTTDLTEATDSHYNGRTIIWITGALAGQGTNITAYTGATKLLTFTAVTEAPANLDKFIIV